MLLSPKGKQHFLSSPPHTYSQTTPQKNSDKPPYSTKNLYLCNPK